MDKKNIISCLKQFKDKNILVIGDSMLDQYIFGTADRISPEAPVPVIVQKDVNFRLGGASNVAANIIALGGESTLVTIIGEDLYGKEFLNIAQNLGINTSYIYRVIDRPTTLKKRILAGHQQVVRVDIEQTDEIDPFLRSELIKILYDLIPEYDAIIMSDYDKGFLNMELIPFIIERCIVSGKPVIVDPKPKNSKYYEKATLISPNHKEAEEIAGIRFSDNERLDAAGQAILEALNPEYLLITLGEKGMALFENNKKRIDIPSVEKSVFDVTGAGDLVVSVMAMCFAANLPFYESALCANIAASIEVTKLGNVSVTIDELIAELEKMN